MGRDPRHPRDETFYSTCFRRGGGANLTGLAARKTASRRAPCRVALWRQVHGVQRRRRAAEPNSSIPDQAATTCTMCNRPQVTPAIALAATAARRTRTSDAARSPCLHTCRRRPRRPRPRPRRHRRLPPPPPPIPPPSPPFPMPPIQCFHDPVQNSGCGDTREGKVIATFDTVNEAIVMCLSDLYRDRCGCVESTIPIRGGPTQHRVKPIRDYAPGETSAGMVATNNILYYNPRATSYVLRYGVDGCSIPPSPPTPPAVPPPSPSPRMPPIPPGAGPCTPPPYPPDRPTPLPSPISPTSAAACFNPPITPSKRLRLEK